MIDKLKRKDVSREDRKSPGTIEQLIMQYDLDSVWIYIDKIIDEINEKGG